MTETVAATSCLTCIAPHLEPLSVHSEPTPRAEALWEYWSQRRGYEYVLVCNRAIGMLIGNEIVARSTREQIEAATDATERRAIARIQLILMKRLIGHALLQLAEAIRDLPPLPARQALLAALEARNAAIEGDTQTVDAFAKDWLGLRHPGRWRAAVEAALLGDWVTTLGRGMAHDRFVLDLLRRHTEAEHTYLQPLWERRARGRRVCLLSQPVGVDLTLQDLLVDHRGPDAAVLAAEYDDSRLAAVLRGLRNDEEALAAEWACTGGTWAQAAATHDRAPEFGERVRRKLKRLGTQHTMRHAPAGGAGA
ncbi:hypothetical protein ACWEBX_17220 [Streptomyces sp. NPDC005070]